MEEMVTEESAKGQSWRKGGMNHGGKADEDETKQWI